VEKYFPESETLSIKRLKVAIEKNNWELLESGLKKNNEMKKLGHKYKQPDLWQNLLLWAETKGIPPEQWERLNHFVNNISDSFVVESRSVKAVEKAEKHYEESVDQIDKDVAIVYNQYFDKNVFAAVGKYRAILNNIIHNPSKFSSDHKLIEDIAKLATNFDEPQDELKGFMSLISLFKSSGSIITSSFSGNLHKMLVKSDINTVYPGINHEVDQSGKVWEFFPLGGTINCFICTGCGNRLVKTEFYSKTLVECCAKCKNPMYPDIVYTGDNYSEVLPKTWYSAYERLVSSKIWIVINPPSHNDQIALRNLLMDAAKTSRAEEIYIITHKPNVFDLWKSRFSNLLKRPVVKDHQTSIISFMESYKEISAAQK